jgi:hypothetical protein
MQPINIKVTIDRPVPDARVQILDNVEPRMRSVRFSGRAEGDVVTFRPKFRGSPAVWLVRRLSDEHLKLAFEQEGSVTQVQVTGKLHRRAHAEVIEAFGGY